MKPRTSHIFIILSTAFAFGLASVFHFTYGWLGDNLFAGLFFPVNESVFEHLKLTLYPLAIAWFLFYPMIDLPERISRYALFTCILISVDTCIYIVLSIYYISTCGLGIESDALNIISLLIGMLAGQYLACHIQNHCRIPKWLGTACGILLILMAVAFAYFTLYPLSIPMMIPPAA